MDGKGGHAIGIDLGTTYSCVGVWKHNRVEIIVNDQGNRTTPSHVAFTDKERLVGDGAFNQVIRNPTNSIFGTVIYISSIHIHQNSLLSVLCLLLLNMFSFIINFYFLFVCLFCFSFQFCQTLWLH